MNSFNSHESIYGSADTTYLSQAFRDFIEQSRLIRSKLDTQAYLFDKYIDLLLRAATTELARAAADNGFSSKPPIARLCAEILEGKPRGTQNPMYDKIKEYVDEHPIQYQEHFTQTEFYCAMLSGPMLHNAVKLYQEDLDARINRAVDVIEIQDFYKRICEQLGGETEIEKLNEIFSQRFLIAPPMAAFMQDFTSHLALSLLHRDAETSKQVFQLILDSGIEPSK